MSGISGTDASRRHRTPVPRAGVRVSGAGLQAGRRPPAAKPPRMADDVEGKLAALEARLADLQAEAGVELPAPEPVPAPQAPLADDPLERFGEELRTLASALVAAYDRVLAHERALARTRHRIVLEAQTDVHALAALERALRASAHVHSVQLRAYAGGHASLVVDVG